MLLLTDRDIAGKRVHADELINAITGDAAATLFMVYRCDTGDELAAVCYLLYANRFSGSSRNSRHINSRDDTDNCDRFQRACERKAPFSFRKRAIQIIRGKHDDQLAINAYPAGILSRCLNLFRKPRARIKSKKAQSAAFCVFIARERLPIV
jgi:hypothetical protein